MNKANQSLAEQILEKVSPKFPTRVGLNSVEVAEVKKAVEDEVRVYFNGIELDEDLTDFEFAASVKSDAMSGIMKMLTSSMIKQKAIEKLVVSELKSWENYFRRANYLKLLKDMRMEKTN